MIAPLRFDDQVAVVTGAGRGLGEAYAHALAERGAAVVVNDLGCDVHGEGLDPTLAEMVAERIRLNGGRAVAHVGDVADPGEAGGLVRLAIDTFGRLDILVANAAIRRAGIFTQTTPDDVTDHLAPDLIGTQLLAQAAWPHFIEAGYGRIIVTSSSAIFGSDRTLAYAVAKGAATVLGRSMALAAQKLDADVKVNLLAPHALTRMLNGVYDGDPEAQGLRLTYGAAARVAETVAVLAHERCPSNGNIYVAGAGQVKRIFYGQTVGISGADLPAEEQLARWAEVESLEGWRVVDEGTAEFSIRLYDRAAELFTA